MYYLLGDWSRDTHVCVGAMEIMTFFKGYNFDIQVEMG